MDPFSIVFCYHMECTPEGVPKDTLQVPEFLQIVSNMSPKIPVENFLKKNLRACNQLSESIPPLFAHLHATPSAGDSFPGRFGVEHFTKRDPDAETKRKICADVRAHLSKSGTYATALQVEEYEKCYGIGVTVWIPFEDRLRCIRLPFADSYASPSICGLVRMEKSSMHLILKGKHYEVVRWK